MAENELQTMEDKESLSTVEYQYISDTDNGSARTALAEKKLEADKPKKKKKQPFYKRFTGEFEFIADNNNNNDTTEDTREHRITQVSNFTCSA